MTVYAAAASSDVPAGACAVVDAGGRSIALCRLDNGDLHAIENRCTHDDGPLGEGELDGVMLECPRHGALFDVTNGRARTLPAIGKVDTFTVSEADGVVQIEVD